MLSKGQKHKDKMAGKVVSDRTVTSAPVHSVVF